MTESEGVYELTCFEERQKCMMKRKPFSVLFDAGAEVFLFGFKSF